ncbi:MAG: hypothetical protein FJ271_29425 [Planctomycetes bacterium]|nr:hypothetical protein [Planctomycetota bacterium]
MSKSTESGIPCPACQSFKHRVRRTVPRAGRVERLHHCSACQKRFWTRQVLIEADAEGQAATNALMAKFRSISIANLIEDFDLYHPAKTDGGTI